MAGTLRSGPGWICDSDTVDGTCDIPEGMVVQEFSFVGGVSGGFAQVTRMCSGEACVLPNIPVAAGEPFTTLPKGLAGPCQIAFTGVARWFVSWGS